MGSATVARPLATGQLAFPRCRKKPGTCKGCHREIKPGTLYMYVVGAGSFHEDCATEFANRRLAVDH